MNTSRNDPPMNDLEPVPDVALLRKAVDWARVEAERPWDESEWYQGQYYVDGPEVGKTCEAAYCIAGYVASMDLSYQGMVSIGTAAVADHAAKALGLTDHEAANLFAGSNLLHDIERIAGDVAGRAGETL